MPETAQLRRFVALYDQHHPYTIPAFFDQHNPKRLTPVLKFLRDFKPHIVVHGGDQLDLDVVSFWNKGKPRLKEGSRLHHDYESYNQVLDAVERVTPHADTVYFLEGNHEARIQLLIDEQPELEGLIEVPKNLHLKEREYKWIPQRETAKIGKLYCIHGDWKNGILPQNHTRAALQIYNRNLLYGHCHSNQSATSVSPVDTHPLQATAIGTLGNVNPYWRRNDASAWVNSFACGYVQANGNYQLYVINIVGGKFIFDGRLYE